MLLLRELTGARRVLPVWIGVAEAEAIEVELARTHRARPLTHQLLARVVEGFGRRIERVIITGVHGGQVHAQLLFDSRRVVSARTSDAVAIALHACVPIYATEALLEMAGFAGVRFLDVADPEAAPLSGADAEALGEFQKFLDRISPEDFDEH
jgi:hypothetical protein